MKNFEGLNKSEIRKAVKLANKLNNCTDCTVTGYSVERPEDELLRDNFRVVTCEICHNYEERAEFDVVVEVFLLDRRKSWAHS